MEILVLESVTEKGSKWAISFDGSNPNIDDCFEVVDKDTAFRLKKRFEKIFKEAEESIEKKYNDKEKIQLAIRRIGLALNASHNIIATDDPSVNVDEKSWEIDHSEEIEDLKYLENILNK